MAGGIMKQQVGVMIEAADNARPGGDVSEQQAPRGGGREPRWKGHRRVGIERAGRRRIAREAADA